MSIASELTALQQDITEAREAITTKGGTVTVDGGSSQLAEDIATIPTGGGAEVDACARRGADTAQEDDKVLLLPSDVFGNQSVELTQNTSSSSSSLGNDRHKSQMYGSCSLTAFRICIWWDDYSSTLAEGTFDFVNNRFNSTVTSSRSQYSGPVVFYRDNLGVAIDVQDIGDGFNNTAGYFKDGVYVPMLENFHAYDASFCYYNRGVLISPISRSFSYEVAAYFNGKTAVKLNAPTTTSTLATRRAILTRWNNKDYIAILGNSLRGVYEFNTETGEIATTSSYSVEAITGDSGVLFALDDDGDSIIAAGFPSYGSSIYNVSWRNIIKSETGWSIQQDVQKSAMLVEGINGSVRTIITKDAGDIVKIAVIGEKITSTGGASYFEYSKTTNVLQKRGDFLNAPDGDFIVAGCNVNFEDGIAVFIGSLDADKYTKKVYVSKISSELPYEFVAVPLTASSFIPEALTGFVKENKGVDALGNTVLTVSTTKDPNAEPWTDVGKLYGFNTIVTPGEEE